MVRCAALLLLALLLPGCESSRPAAGPGSEPPPQSEPGSASQSEPGSAAWPAAQEPRPFPVNEWPEEECRSCHDVRFILRGEELVACEDCLGSPAALVERLAAIRELADAVREAGEPQGTMRCPFCLAGTVEFEVDEERRMAATCATPGCVMVTAWYLDPATPDEE